MKPQEIKNKQYPAEKVCQLCNLSKPIINYRPTVSNQRVNKKGVLIIYQYRDSYCDGCRTKLNREKMRHRNGYYERRKKGARKAIYSHEGAYTKQVYDNAFVFSSDINRWMGH